MVNIIISDTRGNELHRHYYPAVPRVGETVAVVGQRTASGQAIDMYLIKKVEWCFGYSDQMATLTVARVK